MASFNFIYVTLRDFYYELEVSVPTAQLVSFSSRPTVFVWFEKIKNKILNTPVEKEIFLLNNSGSHRKNFY